MKQSRFRLLTLGKISFLYVVGLLSWFAVWMIFGEPFLLMVVLNRMAAWLFFPALVIAGYALFRKTWDIALFQLIPAGIFLFLYWPYLVPSGASLAGTDTSSRIRVLTFNVGHENTNADNIATILRRSASDVVCLQELNPDIATNVINLVSSQYPWHKIGSASPRGSCAIFSRLKPASFEEAQLSPQSSAVFMSIATPKHETARRRNGILVVSARLSGYHFSNYPVTAYATAISEQTQLQHREARRLAFEILKRRQLAILGIDTNSSETCFTYRVLANNLGNSAREVGWRPSTKPIPGTARDIRIGRHDYLFYSESGIQPEVVCRTDDNAGSDHDPVVADFYLSGVNVANLRLERQGAPGTSPTTREMVSRDAWSQDP